MVVVELWGEGAVIQCARIGEPADFLWGEREQVREAGRGFDGGDKPVASGGMRRHLRRLSGPVGKMQGFAVSFASSEETGVVAEEGDCIAKPGAWLLGEAGVKTAAKRWKKAPGSA